MLAVFCFTLAMSAQPQSWRDFRARLVTISTTGEAASPAVSQQPESAKLNSAHLKQQMSLAKNRANWPKTLKIDDEPVVWAHPTLSPEVGGLLCAAPLQAQLVHQLRTNSDPEASPWAAELGRRLDASLDELDERLDALERERWLEKTPYLYTLATTMANEAFKSMGLSFQASAAQRVKKLWEAQQRALSIRLRVCLVLDVDADGHTCRGLSLSQPLAWGLCHEDRLDVARRLLYGAPHGDRDAAAVGTTDDDDVAAQFIAAFGGTSVIYKGGPDGHSLPGVCVHGLPGRVDGSKELAPGTGVYLADVTAATQAVLDGRAPPEAFRIFAGWHEGLSVADGAWVAAACSPSLVLRQSTGLITPLWHEVLDLCGGEYAEMSAAVFVESAGGSGTSRRRQYRNYND